MRTPKLVLLVALLLPCQAAAQAAGSPSADAAGPRRVHASRPPPRAEPPAPLDAPGPRRDRLAGAALGLGIGAVVGGVGFAAMHVAKTEHGAGEYTVLSLMLGGMVGGAAGTIVGAIVGVPGRSAGNGERARLRAAPDLAQGSPAVSLAVDVAW